MVQFNPNAGAIRPNIGTGGAGGAQKGAGGADFGKIVQKQISNVNGLQDDSASAVKDLLAGKSQDVNSMVAAVAKSDMSFKLMVGVRNKIIEAYKETMRMQI
jgi:flagellar hook-basal body complex protein FliE